MRVIHFSQLHLCLSFLFERQATRQAHLQGTGANFSFGDDVKSAELHGPDGSSTLLNFKCSAHSFLRVIVSPLLHLCPLCADGISSVV